MSAAAPRAVAPPATPVAPPAAPRAVAPQAAPVVPPAAPVVPPAAPVVPLTAGSAAEVEADCPYKGVEFDANDECCRKCEDADQCNEDTTAKQTAAAPQRRPR